MAKTKEELSTLKQEYETLTTKLSELTYEELKVVTGGFDIPGNNHDYAPDFFKENKDKTFEPNF